MVFLLLYRKLRYELGGVGGPGGGAPLKDFFYFLLFMKETTTTRANQPRKPFQDTDLT